MNNNSTKDNDEIEIDLRQVFSVILSRIVPILLITAICGIISFVGTKLLISPVYQSSTSLYVLNKQSTNSTSYSDLQSATQLTQDYMILVKSRAVTEKVIADLNLDTTPNGLSSTISTETPTGTRMLNIYVKNTDPYLARTIADKLAEVVSDSIKDIMQVNNVSVVEYANLPTTPVSPNVKKNTMIAALIAFVLCVAFVVVKFILDDRIHTGDDIEKYFGISTLALIPYSEEFDVDAKSKKKHGKKGNSSNQRNKSKGEQK